MVKESFFEKVTLELRTEGNEGVCGRVWGKSRGNSMCKGPEVGTCEEATVTAEGKARERK